MRGYTIACFVLVIGLEILLTEAQFPPRLNIPGAVLLSPGRGGAPQRPHRIQHGDGPPLRARKPIPNALPISIPIREDSEDDRPSILDDEAARLNVAALHAKQQQDEDDEPPRPIQFRPERPVPVLRQDLRDSPPPRPPPRQDFDDEPPIPIVRQQLTPARQAPSPPVRQAPQPVRQQKQRASAPSRPPPPQYLDDDDDPRRRNRKPPIQILRKYRTDNEDGSITWGFENEDGTFKEETIGVDCVISGKYGYVDPEGTRREYSYEAGNKCDHPEEEYPLEELPPQQNLPRPSNRKQQQQQQQPQYRV